MRISRRKFIAFAVAAFFIALGGMLATLLAADLYVHRKFERAAGMNIWGYRGPTLGRKGPNEIRIAVVGGSTALGYGLDQNETFPSQLQAALAGTDAGRSQRLVVVNLGYNNQGAYSFRFTLEDYRYLDYDIVCLYEGYNDLGPDNRRVSRRDSGIFRLTGYYPMLPIIATEKSMQLRYGNLNDAYRRRAVFRPNLAARSKASALETSVAIMNAIDRHDVSGESQPPRAPEEMAPECPGRWAFYCQNVALAVEDARRARKPVLVVTQPYINDIHRDQQRALAQMLAARFGGDPLVKHVNLGDAVDVHDINLCWDTMHLTGAGNQRIADGLVQPVLDALRLVNRQG